jgi:hypothetical protein
MKTMKALRWASVGAVLAGCLLPIAFVCMADASSQPAPLGITKFSLQTIERTEVIAHPNGNSGPRYEFVNKPYTFTQAGGHPWALTTTAAFTTEEVSTNNVIVPTQDPKDVVAGLPPGLLGDPQAVPRCPLALVTGQSAEHCPPDTQVGWYVLVDDGSQEQLGPIVNVAPEAGQSAEFALEQQEAVLTPLLTAHLVRTAQGEYGFTVVSNELPQLGLRGFELTFWGVPADQSHDPLRGMFCVELPGEPFSCAGGGQSSGSPAVPFLSLPTDCAAGPETATLRADSWEEPGSVREGRYAGYAEKSATLPGVTGCNLLQFDPSIEVQPDKLLADEPVGLGVTVGVPQDEQPGTNATPHLRDAVVTLPEGMSISPGIVDGIQACNEAGPEGINFDGPESEEVAPNGELQLAAGHCPDASTVGEAEAITPLLGEPVKGHVYLARPLCGGAGQAACTDEDALDGHLYQLYLELGGSGALADAGVNIKAHGFVEADPATGQLTTKFLDDPQAPFSDLKIRLNGGPRAPIANPAVCGIARTTADFTPWSAPGITPAPESLAVAGTPDATPFSFFAVEGCAGSPPFAPSFTAGTVTPQAGQFSAFTMNLSRADREQYVKGIQVRTPPGLLGMLSSVPLCGEAEAQAGTCPQAAKIGTTRVATGAGSHPFEIEGDVYLTGPYRGDPFGLSIVVHVVAGPFDLGLVVVRARIAVDPENSTLTITTDETGLHAVPQIVFGVPVRLKRITVDIDRPGFMFNPTNCAAQQIQASISGSQQSVATVASPFAVGGCRSLAFKPEFEVSTDGQTSRADGASLDVKLSYPAGSFGSEANIARVKVELPKQLPSRLTTLQRACPAAQFEANPGGCPAASVVGVVRASTPLLPVELTGPAYFVSHGGEAFPSLIVVLQGDGVRVDLTGSTFISAKGITSSTFKTVPDVPVHSFELYLPQGGYSALAANGDLCSLQSAATVRRKVTRRVHGRLVHRTLTLRQARPANLSMPTEFVAQNGAVIRQSTKIGVTGCPTGRTAHAARARASRGAARRSTGQGSAGARLARHRATSGQRRTSK